MDEGGEELGEVGAEREGGGHLGGVVDLTQIVYIGGERKTRVGRGEGRGQRSETGRAEGSGEVGSRWYGWVARGGLGEAARVGCRWVPHSTGSGQAPRGRRDGEGSGGAAPGDRSDSGGGWRVDMWVEWCSYCGVSVKGRA